MLSLFNHITVLRRMKKTCLLVPLKFCMFTRSFSAKNNQVSDRRKSCGRPNILCWTFALRTSVTNVIRKVPAVCCAGIILLLQSMSLTAVDLTDLLNRALERDLHLQRLGLALENQELKLIQEKADRGATVTLAAEGNNALSYKHDFDPARGENHASVELGPTLTAELGAPLYTTVSLTAPVSYDFEREPSLNFKPGVTQPLNPLLGWTPVAAANLEIQNSIEKARITIMNRRIAVQVEVLSHLKSLVQEQQNLVEHESRIRVSREELIRRQKLYQSREEGYAFQKLLYEISDFEEERELTLNKIETLKFLLAQQLGELQDVNFIVPEFIPAMEIILPEEQDADFNAAVFENRRAVLLTEERIREQRFDTRPELSVGASFDWQDKQLSLSFGVSQEIFDSRRKKLAREEEQRNHDMALIALQEVLLKFRVDLAALKLSALELEKQKKSLEAQVRLANLKLGEKRILFKNSVVGRSELLQAEWEREDLDFTVLILKLDRLILNLDARALVVLKELTETRQNQGAGSEGQEGSR